MNGKRVRDSRASEHVAECKSVVRASEHGQSVARASPIAIAWTERRQSVERASPEQRQSVAGARERRQNVAKASAERYKTFARASPVELTSFLVSIIFCLNPLTYIAGMLKTSYQRFPSFHEANGSVGTVGGSVPLFSWRSTSIGLME